CRWFLGAQRSSRSEVQHGEEVVPHVRQSIARPTERPDEYQKEEDDDGRRDDGSQAIPLALLGILHVRGLSRAYCFEHRRRSRPGDRRLGCYFRRLGSWPLLGILGCEMGAALATPEGRKFETRSILVRPIVRTGVLRFRRGDPRRLEFWVGDGRQSVRDGGGDRGLDFELLDLSFRCRTRGWFLGFAGYRLPIEFLVCLGSHVLVLSNRRRRCQRSVCLLDR